MAKKRKKAKRDATPQVRTSTPRRALRRTVREPAVDAMRWFDAAKADRLTASWATSNQSINTEIYYGLNPLRARARDLWANNEYAKRYIETLKSDCVGPQGVRLQMRALLPDGRPDVATNEAVERAWNRNRRIGAYDVTGRLSGVDGERLFIETAARDGECLIRIHREDGYRLEFVDVDRLDVKKNDVRGAATGNRVIMGVEVDDMDRAVAYHVLKRHPQGYLTGGTYSAEHERVVAGDMMHCYVTTRAEQLRGVPWMHAGMVALWDLGGYREAAIVACRVGAAKLGWWKTPDADSGPFEQQDDAGQKITTAEAGEFGQVGPDDELVSWDPTYPHSQYGSFHKTTLQGVSGALPGATYHALASDLEGVNFTSGRLGNLAAHDIVMGIQNWMVSNLYHRLFPDWVNFSLSTGRLDLPMADADRIIDAATWQPRRWSHVQPREEAAANALQWGLRVKSMRQISAEMGTDIDETHAQIARELAQLEAMGIAPTVPISLQSDAALETDEDAA